MKFLFYQGLTNRFTLPYLIHSAVAEGFPWSVFSNPGSVQTDAGDIFILSFLTPEAPVVHTLIAELKQKFPDNVIIAGGHHVSGNPQCALNTLGIDYAVTGYADAGWCGYVTAHVKERGAQKIIHLPEVESIDALLPCVDGLSCVPPLEIQRGCGNACAYCAAGTYHSVTQRTRYSISEYLRYLKKRGYTRTGFVTPQAFPETDDTSKDENLIEWLLDETNKSGITHTEYGIFPSEADPDISKKNIGLIKKYCSNRIITIGCQSGSDTVLQRLNRRFTTEDSERACAYVAEEGLRPVADFIIGFPGETAEEQAATLSFARKLVLHCRARIQIHYFIPLPGTALEGQMPSALSSEAVRDMEKMRSDGCLVSDYAQHIRDFQIIKPWLEGYHNTVTLFKGDILQ